MPDKFQNKYRIASARLQNWDYGCNAPYFVTICTKDREHYFGEIRNGEMQLNELGILAEKLWQEIPKHFPFVELGNFVVMPNHVHGILVFNKQDHETGLNTVETPKLGVSTTTITAMPENNPAGKNKNWKPATLGVIINQYKRMVTIQARKIQADFAWQSRFHDHIFRDEIAFKRISDYIQLNPSQWISDKFYS